MDYVIFRSVAGNNYAGDEPARFDTVTVVTAPDSASAVRATISAIGLIGTYAAIPCELFEYGADTKIAKGGRLVVESGDILSLDPGDDGPEDPEVIRAEAVAKYLEDAGMDEQAAEVRAAAGLMPDD